jgi:anthranilate phosphoribosyltransferase
VRKCIDEVGVGFMFAPMHHSAMKHAIGPRKEMGVRTLFNLLGPLTNPAGAPHQVLGVFSKDWVQPVAEVLKQLGSKHALVVHSQDGMDEISIAAPTDVAELKDGAIRCYQITPEDFGFERGDLATIKVADAQESLAIIQNVLAGKPGPARDIVVLNAGAAIYAADLVDSLTAGIAKAAAVIDSGAAREKLDALVRVSNSV